MAELIAELNHYFSENHTPDSPLMTVWEAHKQLNQGFFFKIKHGLRLKRAREQKVNNLLIEIESRRLTRGLGIQLLSGKF